MKPAPLTFDSWNLCLDEVQPPRRQAWEGPKSKAVRGVHREALQGALGHQQESQLNFFLSRIIYKGLSLRPALN